MRNRRAPAGFSLVELMVALVILTAGILAMASASTYSVLSIRVASSRTQRTAAESDALEQVRAQAFNGNAWNHLTSLSQADALTIGKYQVWYDVGAPQGSVRMVTIYTDGPSYRPQTGWQLGVRDTFVAAINRPFP